MIIEKNVVDGSLQRIRGLYRSHMEGQLSPSGFVTKARTELHALYMRHTHGLIEATVLRFTEELRFFQTQFALDLSFDLIYFQVTRGYRGIRAKLYVGNKERTYYRGTVEIFVGPFDEWDKVAVHTIEERKAERQPGFYTKRRNGRWLEVENFDFPGLLQWIKEETERPEPEDEKDIPF